MWLVPRSHPWREFFVSQADVVDELTQTALRPRMTLELGPRRRCAPKAVLMCSLSYLAVADFVSVLPGPGLVDDPITPVKWAGLSESAVDTPSLPEMVMMMLGATPF